MAFDNLVELWQSFEDKDDLRKKIQELENISGLDFETEILGSLTGEIAVAANISDEDLKGMDNSIPWRELVAFMGLKEKAKWKSVVEAMQKLTDTTVKKEYKYKGETVTELSLSQNKSETLAYSLPNETFIATTSTNKMQNILDNIGNSNKSAEMETRLKELPAAPSLLLDFNSNKLLPYLITNSRDGSINTSHSQLEYNLGTGEYTISPTPDGLWMCFRVISGSNLIEIFGEIASDLISR